MIAKQISKMSMQTIATLPRLSATALSDILLAHSSSNLDAPSPSHLAIIDVRDDGRSLSLSVYHLIFVLRVWEDLLIVRETDHIGGHIKGSQHVPSTTLDIKIPELVRKLADKEIVVFHCALSQQRGPGAALRYIRERKRILGEGTKVPGSLVSEALKKE